jgi:TRAP-type C4-dicarboxylate transport system substrate-binding protein
VEKKNLFFIIISLSLVILLVGLPFSAFGAAKSKKLRLHSYAPPPPAASGIGMKYFMDEVEKRTNGEISFQVFWSGALAPPKGQLHLIQKGAVDIQKTCTLYFPGKFVISHFEYSFPFNPTDPVIVSRAKRQIYDEFKAKRDEYKKFNTIMLANHICPYYQLLSRVPIRNLEDLKGKKIAVIGRWFGKWLEPVGVAPVITPAGDRYVNLQSGVIDADLLWLDLQYALSLHEQSKYMVPIPFGSFVAEDIMMNLDSFNKLSPKNQKILLEVGRESEDYVANYLKQRRQDVTAKMKETGLEVIAFPEADIKEWAAKIPDTPAVWAAEAEKAGLPGWEIAKRWQEITSEMGYKWPRKWAEKK